jgi:hypothetical protein
VFPRRTQAEREALSAALLEGLDVDALRGYAVDLTAELLREADGAERLAEPVLVEATGYLLNCAWLRARFAHRAPWGLS